MTAIGMMKFPELVLPVVVVDTAESAVENLKDRVTGCVDVQLIFRKP